MTSPAEHLVVVRGGGDIGSGAIWRLRRVGFPVIVLELARPLTVRRTVAFSTAVSEGRVTIEGIEGRLVASATEAVAATHQGAVPVLVSEGVPELPAPVSVIVDARLAKAPLDTTIDQAPLVIGLGPGFVAGLDCHAVIETMRGHRLGRVIWDGPAAPNSGVPGEIGGASAERVVRAPGAGVLTWDVSFGDVVEAGQQLGSINGMAVVAGIGGMVRGLILPGPVTAGLKIGDVDPRVDPDAISEVSDKAISVGGGALEAVLVWLDTQGR